MFGMGFGEIVLIVIVALLFIGPDKLPQAAKTLSKGIRDVRKQTRELRDTIEDDTVIGDAIRDLQSALRGDELRAAVTRHKVNAQKLITGESTVAPAALTAGAATSAAGAATSKAAPAAETAPSAEPSPSPEPEPVVTASAGAVARGAAITPPAPADQVSAVDGATAGDGEAAPVSDKPASGQVHG